MANLEEKQALVKEIQDKLAKAKSFIVVDYRGLNVEEVNDLRKQSRENDVEYKVYKNTMVIRALNQAEIEGLTDFFAGPTGIALSYIDEVAPAKIFSDFSKNHENLEIKAGYVDGNAIGVEEIKSLAALPSKEVLIAKALGGLNAPITGLVGTLGAVISGFARVLGQIRDQKQEQE